MTARWPMLLGVLALAGCSGADGKKGGGPGTGGPSTGSTSGDPRVVLGGPVACADPGARLEQVFDRVDYGQDWEKPPGYRQQDWDIGIGGRGIAVADFDGDGLEDLLVPGHHQPTHLLLGGAAGFVDGTEGAFGGNPPEGHQGVTAADLDGDGDQDAILYAIDALPVILWNDGSGRFATVQMDDWDDAHAYPCGGSASVADFDGDGVLDVFYGRLGVYDRVDEVFTPCDSMLFQGKGGGAFLKSDALPDGPLQEVRVLASGWHDFDRNGWPDLYAIADCAPSPQPNQLLLNQGGVLSYAPESGMHVRLAGMGLAVGDLNGDEVLDAVVPGIDEYAALLSTEVPGVWADGATAVGLLMDVDRDMRVGWGLELADLDNDGFLDLATAFGRDRATLDMPWFEPNAIHHNRGDGTFEEVGAQWGFDEDTVERGLVAADLNDDGWLDLVTREVGGLVSVYTARCGGESWLQVQLRDPTGSNPSAVGATVVVEAAGQRWMRTVSAGSTSYASSGGPDLHVGLADVEHVDRIEVTWPGGEVTVYEDVAARQKVELWRE